MGRAQKKKIKGNKTSLWIGSGNRWKRFPLFLRKLPSCGDFVRTDPIVPYKDCPPPDPSLYSLLVGDKTVSLLELRAKHAEYGVSKDKVDALERRFQRALKDFEIDIYISAAFRSAAKNEAYIFMGEFFLCVNYLEDRIVERPNFLDSGPRWLSRFGARRVRCAFACHRGHRAFIFSRDFCAYINHKIKVIYWQKEIKLMFPFLKDTIFESGLDAAFEAEDDKAYLFKGNQYNYINYEKRSSITSGTITEKFSCLKDTKFEDGIEAAFASHKRGEAYLFKGNFCALINFDDNCLVEVDTIRNKWPNFGSLVPCKNMICV
ncbi:hypothetical protein SLEP1_g44200 [Rubroshorea leprosula]|uniref:Uncharacterized protein n=2 Tax=Rubroshorea leprosula TaxID=152421 RepID=A0AAV5LFI6_9ROSI|nr:hypothetical protein SLEP1_g44200 [Rubroshorea leprosula]